jgi:hypothetical protein
VGEGPRQITHQRLVRRAAAGLLAAIEPSAAAPPATSAVDAPAGQPSSGMFRPVAGHAEHLSIEGRAVGRISAVVELEIRTAAAELAAIPGALEGGGTDGRLELAAHLATSVKNPTHNS